jgi:hypothetical protein
VSFRDSTATLELIEGKRVGVLATLQEQCLFPKVMKMMMVTMMTSHFFTELHLCTSSSSL